MGPGKRSEGTGKGGQSAEGVVTVVGRALSEAGLLCGDGGRGRIYPPIPTP